MGTNPALITILKLCREALEESTWDRGIETEHKRMAAWPYHNPSDASGDSERREVQIDAD